MKKLHILDDSLYYSDWYVENCESIPSDWENIYICITNSGLHITNKITRIIRPNSEDLNQIIKEINSSNLISSVFINYLDYNKSLFINAITNSNVKFFWIIWGGDLYGLDKLRFNKYNTYSQKYINKQNPLKHLTLKQRIGRLKLKYWNRVELDNKKVNLSIYKAIARLNGCATFIEKEVEILREYFNPNLIHIPFAIVSADNNSNVVSNSNKNILIIGHSADPSNNHWEMLEKLSAFKNLGEIVMPLSYGETQYARELINDLVKMPIAKNITPLLTPLTKSDYYELLSKARVATYGQNIQQAFGNIIALLFFGAKVFLKEKNPLFHQLKKYGVKIFSVEKDFNQTELTTPMSEEDVKLNTHLIEKYLGAEAVHQYYHNLLSH